MSYVDGFTKGFGLVNGLVQQNRNNERQTMLDDRNEERYREGLALQKSQAELEAEWKQKQFDANQNWKGQEVAMNQQQFNANQANADRTFGLQQQEAARQNELRKLQTMEARNKIAGQYLDSYLQSGQIDEKGKGYLADSVFSGTFNAVNDIKQDFISVLDGYDKVETPEQLIQFANSPKTLSVVNASMRNELYSRDKATGNKHEVIALEPAPGGVIPILRITSPDGSVVTAKAPATKNRSSGGDDQIMVVPISEMKNKITNSFRFADYAGNDPVLKGLLTTEKELNQEKIRSETNKNNATAEYYRNGKAEVKDLNREQKQAKETIAAIQKSLTVTDEYGNKSIREPNEREAAILDYSMRVLAPNGAFNESLVKEPPPKPSNEDDKIGSVLSILGIK